MGALARFYLKTWQAVLHNHLRLRDVTPDDRDAQERIRRTPSSRSYQQISLIFGLEPVVDFSKFRSHLFSLG